MKPANSPRKELKNKNLFKRDTPLYITFILVIVSGLIVYGFFPQPEEGKKVAVLSQSTDCTPDFNIIRSKDYQLTHRVLLAETRNETPKLASIKEQISEAISQNKFSNTAREVSVYYRNLDDGSWFEINGGNRYTPASLLKVAFLITVLKQAEADPGFLDKQIYFARHFQQGYNQNIQDFSLQEKKFYTMRELLYNMIVHSDNDALILVSNNINNERYYKLFSDLGIAPPEDDIGKSVAYSMTIVDYCKFFRVLYNSSYLKEEYSEFALELLTKSTYRGGLLKNLNSNCPVAHKFGERIQSNNQELHEVGIFYVDHKPYLLGIMSVGGDLKKLSNVLSQISQIIYKESSNAN